MKSAQSDNKVEGWFFEKESETLYRITCYLLQKVKYDFKFNYKKFRTTASPKIILISMRSFLFISFHLFSVELNFWKCKLSPPRNIPHITKASLTLLQN